jgi:hypothetical protein
MADGNGNQAATKVDLASLKVELKADIESAKMETFERIERSETTLLKEFRKWMSRNDVQLKLQGARDISYDQRISLLEGRVAELEEHR